MPSASVGPSWSLRASASPRCLAAYAVDDNHRPGSSASDARGPVGVNPFDDDLPSAGGGGGSTGRRHAAAFGTERGSLHHRVYPAEPDGAPPLAPYDRNRQRGYRAPDPRRGAGAVVEPDASVPEGQIDLQGAVKGSVVGIVRADPGTTDDGVGYEGGGINPIFLLLVDDNRSHPPASGSVPPGAYGAHLVTVRGGSFQKLPPAAPAAGAGGVGSGSGFDGRGGNPSSPPAAAALGPLPRMSCASHRPETGYVYASGTAVRSLPSRAADAVLSGLVSNPALDNSSGAWRGGRRANAATTTGRRRAPPRPTAVYVRSDRSLPHPGARRASGTGGAMALCCGGRAAVVAVSNSFYAVPAHLDMNAGAGGSSVSGGGESGFATGGTSLTEAAGGLPEVKATRILTFAQSSQVHPVIALEVRGAGPGGGDVARQKLTSLVLLASGRECATLDLTSTAETRGGGAAGGLVPTSVSATSPRHGTATLPSPILAASSLPPPGEGGDAPSNRTLVALLTADGLVHVRSPTCVAVPLSSVEVGTRPNDYFTLVPLGRPSSPGGDGARTVVAASYGGEARLVSVRPDGPQDFADRLLKLSIDCFGSNGFPRLELAEATGATFSATSYVGPEPTGHGRALLRQYLESVLGLDDGGGGGGRGHAELQLVVSDDDGGGTEVAVDDGAGDGDAGSPPPSSHSASSDLGPDELLTCTALLCLVCFQLGPAASLAACRAARSCASAMGTVRPAGNVSRAAMAVCSLVADRLLKEVDALVRGGRRGPTQQQQPRGQAQARPRSAAAGMEYFESSLWLLRCCGCHERALSVLQERMSSPSFRNASSGSSGGWSQIKFDSYLTTHLSELWSSRDDRCMGLVLTSPATAELLARNPTLGLGVFVSTHPRNGDEWSSLRPGDDPLSHPTWPARVVDLLKSVMPPGGDGPASPVRGGVASLPLTSGRALAVAYLESATGISTGRPADAAADLVRDGETPDGGRAADMHDELSYLLLEGVVAERGDGDGGTDTPAGAAYRDKLRRLLAWPGSRIRSERLLSSLPPSFLREHALLLGRLGRHEHALGILYSRLGSLDLALEYCDVRRERQLAGADAAGGPASSTDCPYLPLIRVVLSSDPDDPDRGAAAAVRVLALRRGSVDKVAALKMLPGDLPVSSLARPFLIPAVVEDESRARRLMVASSLLRSRHARLRKELVEAQLTSQADVRSPALARLGLGELVRASRGTRARPVHATSPWFPDVLLTRYHFRRSLVIQAQVANAPAPVGRAGAALADVAFVVAESSDEAIVPRLELPLGRIPPGSTGSVWCVLAASPGRLDGSAFLTSELRFTVRDDGEDEAGGPGGGGGGEGGRSFVEELHDIEIRRSDFE